MPAGSFFEAFFSKGEAFKKLEGFTLLLATEATWPSASGRSCASSAAFSGS